MSLKAPNSRFAFHKFGKSLSGKRHYAKPGRKNRSCAAELIDLGHGLIEPTNIKNVDAMMSFYDGTDRLYIFDAVLPLKYAGTRAWRKSLEGFIAAYNPGILELIELQIVNDVQNWICA
jgi:hypothetical protein